MKNIISPENSPQTASGDLIQNINQRNEFINMREIDQRHDL